MFKVRGSYCVLALVVFATLLALFLALAGGTAFASGSALVPTQPTPPAPDRSGPTPAAAQQPAASPRPPTVPADLAIHYISRAPRYRRYCLDYTHNVPDLCAGTADEKRFPDPGETVTLTARVVNQGDVASAATTYIWTVDEQPQATRWLPPLAPGAVQDLSITWPWQTGVHTLTLSVTPATGELTAANNQLAHRTDAHYLDILVHPLYIEAFRAYQNLVSSYGFEDWLQAQFAQMNQRLAAAVYPDTPQGIRDRIRVDIITTTEQVGGDIVMGELAFDGRWTFRPGDDDPDTEVYEPRESAYNYARTFAGGIDWGLIHELTHQLGVIDLYQLNVSPSAGNLLRDREGWRLLSGFYFTSPGRMGGDDVRPYPDDTYYSLHTARALNTNSGYRRGYFGEYLYDVPETIHVRVVDRQGDGVSGASVTGYQTDDNIVATVPVLTGTTDSAGIFTLPNRAVNPGITTATGHTLRPNPYADINVVGQNGQMLLRVLWQDQESFAWLPITEMNKAFWRGAGASFTITLPTHFPPATQDATAPRGLAAPQELAAYTQGGSVRLTWQPVAGAVSYNIYRGLWPQYYPFSRIADSITGTTYSVAITQATRFAVTAVASDGSETGFGRVVRAERLFAPQGLIWEPDPEQPTGPGRLMVVDGHPGALLMAYPPACGPNASCPLRWLGRVGSEHIGLVGASDAARAANGLIAVPTAGNQRIWLVDGEQRLVNWFGREGDYPTVLDRPSALLLGGEQFTVSVPLTRPDAAASLLLPFDDGNLNDPDGTAPSAAAHVDFVAGRFGQAIAVTAETVLHYPAADNFNVTGGSVELWVRPGWRVDAPETHVLLDVAGHIPAAGDATPGYQMQLAQQGEWVYIWVTDFISREVSAWGNIRDWQPGEWHHVAAAWEDHRLLLYVDGRLAGSTGMRRLITGTVQTIAIGSTVDGEAHADAALDQVRISTVPQLGNSRRVRVLVAEERQGAVRVFDLLGNVVSLYQPAADTPGALAMPSALAWGDGGAVWLADAAAQRIHALHFDGDSLTWVRPLSVTLSGSPQALATQPGGLLAVAEGDRVLLVDTAAGDALRGLWLAPNDGSAGPFRRPVALTFGPAGDLAVGEEGYERISFIRRPLLSERRLFPLLLRGG